MMKKRLLFLFLSFPVMLSAQHRLESTLNSLRADDVIIKQQVQYKDPGRKGENVLWDFSKLNILNDAYELFYSTYNDTVITGTEHLTNYRYVLQNDYLLLWGFENQTTKLHNVQPELLLKFPVNYGNKVQSNFYAHGKYGNRLELDAMGVIETSADAYGMMILPSKDTLKHVLRTHSLKYIAEDTRPIGDAYYEKRDNPLHISSDSIHSRLQNDSVVFVVETFRWYEKGYRYPIFETVRSWEQHIGNQDYEFLATAFFYPPQEHYYLDDDEENQALLDAMDDEENNSTPDPWEGLTYNVYPNPVTYMPLEVEMYLPRAANVRANLRSSMGLISKSINNGYQPEGVYSFQMDVSGLTLGNYILDIWLDDHLISEIIMKR
ncbi:MAG: T9SS C-terminal target domain-containing protein [Dysgonamonadaceae bacterium]|jgi:hypothetical protein|nr:T9SS C-terminal target domain-containing protein [Dysgonamonadaceae bacterium]